MIVYSLRSISGGVPHAFLSPDHRKNIGRICDKLSFSNGRTLPEYGLYEFCLQSLGLIMHFEGIDNILQVTLQDLGKGVAGKAYTVVRYA